MALLEASAYNNFYKLSRFTFGNKPQITAVEKEHRECARRAGGDGRGGAVGQKNKTPIWALKGSGIVEKRQTSTVTEAKNRL